jgi:hypothetical protein
MRQVAGAGGRQDAEAGSSVHETGCSQQEAGSRRKLKQEGGHEA